jgi:hypothetical protein
MLSLLNKNQWRAQSMSLSISFESASSAVCYAEEAVPRVLRRGCAAPDIHIIRAEVSRNLRAKRNAYAASIDDPTPALAKYARKCLQERGNLTEIASAWGCTKMSVMEALRMFPEETIPPPMPLPVAAPVLLLLTERSTWSFQCEPICA